MRWSEALDRLQQQGEPHVLVTLIGARGSTPRDSGSKMVVSSGASHGSIGGGNLEYQALAHARQLLKGCQDSQSIERFPLGARLGQCCGGHTSVLFEYFAQAADVALFGAGHVGQALLPLLASLPLRIRWIDSRAERFPAELPVNVVRIVSDAPVEEVATLPPGIYYLIMTHNHQLDYALCEAALQRGDAGLLGVIGSLTKAQRFRQRLARRGMAAANIARLCCPLGLADVPGKLPAEIAISVAAQVVMSYQREAAPAGLCQGVGWQALLDALGEAAEPSVSRAKQVTD